MAEIKINIANLSSEIENLKNLKIQIDNSNIACPNTIGGGTTVTELEEIGRLYKQIHSDFGQLVFNTALFMENIKTSYQESDQKAAINFKN